MRGVFDYIDGGAEDERTLDRNSSDFSSLRFRPRVLRDVSSIETSVDAFGRTHPLPLMLAPTGFTRITASPGELAVARAAERAGLSYSLSTMATRSIEEVAAAAPAGDHWFQVYTWKDRGLVEEMVSRAREAGYRGLWLTVDTAVLGRRERDVRRGYTIPPKVGPGTIVDGVLHPAWTLDFITNPPIVFANVVGLNDEDGSDPVSLAEHMMRQFDQALSWSDVREAVGDGFTIVCDGGVRRGSDIVKALALGADLCSIGRPYLYAMGAAGERGVDHLLGFLQEGLERTMALTGSRRLDEIDRDLVEWV